MAEITTDQLTLLREAHYEGAAYLIAGPQETVFAARVNGAPNAAGDDFAQLTYDTVTTGAYTDLIVDMDVRISHTNDVRKAYFYGRVRKTPTSTVLYINETSADILDNDYIFCLNSFPLVIRQRYKTFVDWDRPVELLPPVESNVPSASVVLTSDASAEFSFLSIGQAIERDATITDVLWSIPDATYTVGSETDAEITITVDTPYNNWGHLTLTDSNGTTNTLHFTITAGDPRNEAHTFFRTCHDPVGVSSDWANGFSGGATYWEGIADLLNRTRITLVSEETFDDEPLGVSNIQFVGYLNASTSTTSGDETHGQHKEAQLEFSGLIQLAGEMRFNQIAIRHAATPTAWDYINTPTPPRNITHLLAHHSTLLNLCALDFGGLEETYLTGNTNIDDGSLTDAARGVAREITAALIQAADGSLALIRDPRLGDDTYRASIPSKTPSPINLDDVYSYTLTEEPYDKVGWEEVGFLVVSPTTGARTYIVANAPASGPGEGQEDTAEPSQLLKATDDLAAALAEAKQRTSDLYALENTHHALEVNFGSGWGGVVRATPGDYYQFVVDAEDDTRGTGIDADDLWLCLSVNTTINRTGTQDTIGQFTEVTQGGDALINAAISPSVVNTPEVVRPYVSPYPSQPMPPSINYDTTDPTGRHSRDPFSGMQPLPLTTEEAAEAAAIQPGVGDAVLQISFRNPSAVNTGFISLLDEPYTIRLSGSAQIASSNWSQTFLFSANDGGFTAYGSADSGVTATYNSGTGKWEGSYFTQGGAGYHGLQITKTFTSSTIIHVDFVTDIGAGTSNTAAFEFLFIINAGVGILASSNTAPSTGTNQTFQWNGSATAAGIALRAMASINFPPSDGGGSASILRVTLSGYGANPFTGITSNPVHADAFYTGHIDPETGGWIDVTPNTSGGVRIDNYGITVFPPFNPNHEYDVTLADFNGTGGTDSVLAVKFLDSLYTDNDPNLMTLRFRGPGTGS